MRGVPLALWRGSRLTEVRRLSPVGWFPVSWSRSSHPVRSLSFPVALGDTRSLRAKAMPECFSPPKCREFRQRGPGSGRSLSGSHDLRRGLSLFGSQGVLARDRPSERSDAFLSSAAQESGKAPGLESPGTVTLRLGAPPEPGESLNAGWRGRVRQAGAWPIRLSIPDWWPWAEAWPRPGGRRKGWPKALNDMLGAGSDPCGSPGRTAP